MSQNICPCGRPAKRKYCSKKCQEKAARRRYYLKHHAIIVERKRAYQRANMGRIMANRRRNIEKYRAYQRVHYHANKERLQARLNTWRKNSEVYQRWRKKYDSSRRGKRNQWKRAKRKRMAQMRMEIAHGLLSLAVNA